VFKQVSKPAEVGRLKEMAGEVMKKAQAEMIDEKEFPHLAFL
jgi:hypothetical protein